MILSKKDGKHSLSVFFICLPGMGSIEFTLSSHWLSLVDGVRFGLGQIQHTVNE
ncbi:MAG: hypothetical protein ACFHW5_14020 [Verrucomicrobiota bacterium]